MRSNGWIAGLLLFPFACGSSDVDPAQPIDGDSDPLDPMSPGNRTDAGVDPNPILTFTQVGMTVGIDRSNEPASAGPFNPTGTLAYGGWLADLDGDGRLDYYGVNHAQNPHLSGLFINDGAGGFGKNLFTVSLQPSPASPPNMGNSNEAKFVGDLTGDGRVDLFFTGWQGCGVACINQGPVQGSDWTGPGYLCYGTTDALAWADANGDGKIDILALANPCFDHFDPYPAYYAHTGPYLWRLNNGDPNIQAWPTTTDFIQLRTTDPNSLAAPFVDLNGDGIPDKIVGIPLPEGMRGPYLTTTAGKMVYLGQANGTYALQPTTGLEAVTEPVTFIEDVNEDGCLDIGTDPTGYRDNQSWYLQNKTGPTCNLTFSFTPRTALPFYPGYRRYTVDLDNSGIPSKVVIVHTAYGSNDGQPVGVTIYRKLPGGDYAVLRPADHGIFINGTNPGEFYADNLTVGDWNDDGRLDFAGSGPPSIANTDSGHALWTSELVTSNGWIKVSLPTVTGFFTGTATIELFEPGRAGHPADRIGPPKVLYSGRAWGSQVHHFGIGTRAKVDVRVTFPDGSQIVRRDVAAGTRITIP